MEDKMCRICFAGPEKEESLGRLIPPYLCKGTMRYVHVECLNYWRLRSQKKKFFFNVTNVNIKVSFNSQN
ncbi:RINGv domain protein [Gigaspora margarita]|uniref:RINGv domain protein n=1 Tax=Gigaspora margarita TaxID=4874 RepID=A0A8H4EJ60_GIGMA|nr:RINGv domain protein [Gigaspora margarita]